jgi:hypothetical protein
MATSVPLQQHTIQLSVASRNEIRLKYLNRDGRQNLVAQRLLSTKPEVDERTYWSYRWLLEIGSFLYEITELRELLPAYINHLGWVLYNEKRDPLHYRVAESIRLILEFWMNLCASNEDCLSIPTHEMAKSADFQKLLRKLNQLKDYKDKHENTLSTQSNTP